MKFRYLFLLLVFSLAADATNAAVAKAAADNGFSAVRRDLKHHFTVEKIRVFYDTEGINAINIADTNNNQVPDQVEDIAKQTWAAYKIFVETLNFPDPLKSDRYKDASYIDVNLLAKKTIRLNGIAYDGLKEIGRPIDEPGTKTISFDVATSIEAHSNITPAHEMFHLIQNGATYFKTRWYTEGMARWSEHILASGGIGKIKYDIDGPWPQTETNLTQLFQMSYDAEFYLWNPLAVKDDPLGLIPEKLVSPVIIDLTYSNGEKILKDFNLNGWEFMRDVLLQLGKMDDIAFKALGYSQWSEDNQKSINNSPFIYQAVMDVFRNRGHKVDPYTAIK